MKPHRIPRLICFVLSLLLALTLFLPMLSANDEARADFELSKSTDPNFAQTTYGKLFDMFQMDAPEGIEDLTPEDVLSLSYFDFAVLIEKTNAIEKIDEFDDAVIILAKVVIWLPFAIAALGLVWSLFSLPIMELINSIFAIGASAYLVYIIIALTETKEIMRVYNIGAAWHIYPYAIVSMLLLITSIWFIAAKSKYKKLHRAKRTPRE